MPLGPLRDRWGTVVPMALCCRPPPLVNVLQRRKAEGGDGGGEFVGGPAAILGEALADGDGVEEAGEAALDEERKRPLMSANSFEQR